MQPAFDGSNVASESLTLAPPVDAALAAPTWSSVQRALLRFSLLYLVLYNFLPSPMEELPVLATIASWHQRLLNAVVSWVGTHLFHVDTPAIANGSGDSTYGYVQVFCLFVIALTASLLWTILARKRAQEARLHEGLRIYVRFALAAAMFAYGAVKVVNSQFPAPPIDRLLQPYGDASPMGLVWTFMGASTAYIFFTGAAEMIGGLLLTVRRTTLLGALVSFAVFSNIVVLNFCYDVPVKLYALHLLAMSVFLVLPDLRRLTDLFVLGRRVEPVAIRPLFRRPWLHRGALILCTALVVIDVAFLLNQSAELNRIYSRRETKPPLYGLWNVDELSIDGQDRPPLVTDRERWRRVIFDIPDTMAVQSVSDSRERYSLKLDKGVMTLGKRGGSKWKTTFSYAQPKPGLLTLEGTLDGKKIKAKLHLEKPPKFLLTTRGFHWINERPFNR